MTTTLVNNKKALIFIFITLLIDCTGIGIIIPVVPTLIRELTGSSISGAASYGGWLTFAYASMQFVFSPILGGLSDRFGRRPIILISLLGLGIDYIFLYLAPTLFWLFISLYYLFYISILCFFVRPFNSEFTFIKSWSWFINFFLI
jgi:DHA1 family tetracycline resistance protein-like MFS transporter